MEPLSDGILLTAWCKGDMGAFDVLFRRYSSRVYATAFRLLRNWQDAEDVLQDVFVELANNAAGVRRGESLRLWLYRVTYSRSMDVLRRGARVAVLLDDGSERSGRVLQMESLHRDALGREKVRSQELLHEIAELIPQLPERQAAAVVLHGFQGLSYGEVAQVLGCAEGAARSNYSLACRRLRELVGVKEKQSKDKNAVHELHEIHEQKQSERTG